MQSTVSDRHSNHLKIGLALLLAFVYLVESFSTLLAAILRIQQHPALSTLLPILISMILALWVHYDSRTTGASLGLDQGMYIFFGWPVTLPIYALKSRGFRSGGLLILAFLGIFVLAYLAALVTAVAVGFGISISSTP